MLNQYSLFKSLLSLYFSVGLRLFIFGFFLLCHVSPFNDLDYTRLKILSASATPSCGLDQFEPNNQRHQAKHLISLTRHKSIHALLCPTDIDWFSIWLNRGQWVEVQLESASLKTLDTFMIFAPHQRKSMGISKDHSLYKSIRIQVRTSGRYRLKVASTAPESTRYTLSLVHLDPRYPHAPILTPSSEFFFSSKPLRY